MNVRVTERYQRIVAAAEKWERATRVSPELSSGAKGKRAPYGAGNRAAIIEAERELREAVRS